MPDKVLIYSRFPKAMMVRIGQRFELMDAAGKPPSEVFTAEQLSGVRAMITAGGTPPGGAREGQIAARGGDGCFRPRDEGVGLSRGAARENRGRAWSGASGPPGCGMR